VFDTDFQDVVIQFKSCEETGDDLYIVELGETATNGLSSKEAVLTLGGQQRWQHQHRVRTRSDAMLTLLGDRDNASPVLL